ncbi:MAG: carotenoid biosynthesis protein [Anaerolineae bacterium]|nr:carotenoid biosynthesis protein [Anaerolineae bacterium]MCA9887214.1 carotenoid biosynthesis protein [Anaerolineae bacterium]
MTSLVRFLRQPAQLHDNRVQYGLIVLWALVMIALPIARWIAGDAIIPGWATMAAIVQAIAVGVVVRAAWGWRKTAITFVIVSGIGWTAEFMGHRTGFPFGSYHYTDALQPQIGGVPLLIPVAWFMLLPSAWVMAQLIIGERDTLFKQITFVAISALALTAWDLFLDPQMVGWGFWVWDQPGVYFGIPLVNYLGWLLVSAIITVVARPARLPIMPLAAVYALVWFLQSVGLGVFWGQPGPAIVGCVAMGSIMVAAYWGHHQRPRS